MQTAFQIPADTETPTSDGIHFLITAPANKPAPEFKRLLHGLANPEPTELEKWVADCFTRGLKAAGPAPVKGAAK